MQNRYTFPFISSRKFKGWGAKSLFHFQRISVLNDSRVCDICLHATLFGISLISPRETIHHMLWIYLATPDMAIKAAITFSEVRRRPSGRYAMGRYFELSLELLLNHWYLYSLCYIVCLVMSLVNSGTVMYTAALALLTVSKELWISIYC